MKAIALNCPKRCEPIESPMPENNGVNVIITISTCGICGSDTHFWELGVGMDGKPGLIMGHEFCGTVHDPGSRTDLAPGQRVTAIPINPCGICPSCENGLPNICLEGPRRPLPGLNTPGGYAEYCSVRPDMVRILPDSVSDHEAALIEPASVSLHAVHQADIRPGHSVLISGGGPVGLLAAMWAKHTGARHVSLIEIDPFRIRFAENTDYIGTVYDARDPGLVKTVRKSTGGFDRVIETSASEAGIYGGIAMLKPRGKMVLTGISMKPQMIPTMLMTIKEIDLKSAFGYTVDEFDECLDHIRSKAIDVSHLVTRSIPLDQVQTAFENLSSGSVEDIKIMIHPNEERIV